MDRRSRRSPALLALFCYALAFLCFLYAPIGLLLALSFNDSETIGLPFKGLTTRWYGEVLASSEFLLSLANSFLVGLASSVIATALGLTLAMGFRSEFALKSVIMKVVLLPIIIPGIVGSVLFLTFFGLAGIPFGLWTTVLLVHVTWVLPFAFLTLYPRLHGFDRSIEEAAMDLGATPFVVFRRVLLPIVRPSLIATVLFGFTLSFDEFIRTFLVIGANRTVPVHLWTLISGQMAPFLPAVGVVIMAVSITASVIGLVLAPAKQSE